jgi:hypothetical protein
MPPVELWSRVPPDNSVGTSQLADGAVTTDKLADGAVTPPKASAPMKSEHILGDDTEVFTTSTTYYEVKGFNFYKNADVESMNWDSIEAVAEGRVAASGNTASVGIFVNNESSPRLEFTFTDTSYSLDRGTFSISDLGTGLHRISIRLKTSSAASRAFQRHLEIKAVKK